VNKDFQY